MNLRRIAILFFALCCGDADAWFFNPPGGGANISWPASGDVVISANSNTPSGIAPSNGQCLIGSGGAWTAGSCTSGSVTATGSPVSGNLAEFSGTSSITNGNLSGDVSTSGTLSTTIGANKVSYAKMQQAGAGAILANPTGSTGNIEEITLGNGLSYSGTTLTAAAGTANSLAGYNNSGTFSDVTIGSGLTLSGGTLTSTGLGGTVTSVGLSTNAPYLTVASSPVTGSGTITLNSTTGLAQNEVLATPNGSNGVVGLRALATADIPTNLTTIDIPFTFDGQGNALTAGSKIYISNIPYNGTITGWTLLADQSGSASVDVWETSYASGPPTITNTIVSSAPPSLSSQQKNTSTTLTGWTTSISSGNMMIVNLTSASTITKLSGTLQVSKQ